MVSTIYYVTQEKELLPTKEDFIENLIAPDEEQLCDFFENEVPFFVERFNAFDRDFEPRFLENNEYFKIKEVDGIFEMELKENAIKRANELYVKTLRDYADCIEKFGERGYINFEVSKPYFKHRDIFVPYDGDRFFQIDLCKDYTDENLIIEPEAINTIYDMVDIAIKQGIIKWYLMPVVGYYR